MTIKYLTTIGVVPNSEREINDFYATDPDCVDDLLAREKLYQRILEPCCGDGSISKRLQMRGYFVVSSDLIDRGFGDVKDFFSITNAGGFDIVTNPPYKNVERYIRHALDIVYYGSKVCMFLKLTSLEGKKGMIWFSRQTHPLGYIFMSVVRNVPKTEISPLTIHPRSALLGLSGKRATKDIQKYIG